MGAFDSLLGAVLSEGNSGEQAAALTDAINDLINRINDAFVNGRPLSPDDLTQLRIISQVLATDEIMKTLTTLNAVSASELTQALVRLTEETAQLDMRLFEEEAKTEAQGWLQFEQQRASTEAERAKGQFELSRIGLTGQQSIRSIVGSAVEIVSIITTLFPNLANDHLDGADLAGFIKKGREWMANFDKNDDNIRIRGQYAGKASEHGPDIQIDDSRIDGVAKEFIDRTEGTIEGVDTLRDRAERALRKYMDPSHPS